MTSLRQHGGPDARGAARWDFSTCSNAAGPCPLAWAAVQQADATRYPDPQSTALRECLAALHGVQPQRIVIAASASEFIQRLTAVGARLLPGPVSVPTRAYGDYGAAASAWQRPLFDASSAGEGPATLRWCADPASPTGNDDPPPAFPGAVPTVLDAVYAPLRLQGTTAWTAQVQDAVFVLHSPNKALGLTGVRGAYAVAPRQAAWDVATWCHALEAATPSWPLSAQAVAMLHSWALPATQAWLRDALAVLRDWKALLGQALHSRGFGLMPSKTPFFCARPPHDVAAEDLRTHDVAVRDAGSFGMAGWWRVSAQPPAAVDALLAALQAVPGTRR